MAYKDHIGAKITAMFLCCIGWFVCVPIMTIYFIKFYRQRRNVMIHKRYAVCTLVIYIIVMIDMIIERPLWLLLEVGYFGPNTTSKTDAFDIILWLSIIFYSFVYFGFSASLLWKFWLLFYDINYSKESQNGEWKQLISPKKDEAKQQWFLTHIHNFGNFKWITIRYFTVIFCLTFISYFLWIYGYIQIINSPTDLSLYNLLKGAQTYDFIINILILIGLIICGYYIPLFYDHFYVREELRLVFIYAMIYYLSVIIFGIFSFINIEVQLLATMFAIIHSFFATISQFAIVMVQTKWVLKKIFPYLQLQTRLRDKSKLVITDLNNAAKRLDEENYSEKQTNNGNEYIEMDVMDSIEFTIENLLQHSMGFESFMMHVIREFSMELLLSYVEFIQFLDFIKKSNIKSLDDNVRNNIYLHVLHLASSVPYSNVIKQTEIMTGENNNSDGIDNDYDLKVSFQILSIGSSLYFKYIKVGGALEINISGPLRSQFINTFEKNEWKLNGDKNVVDIEKIVNVYQKATNQMYKLLCISFSRFKLKSDYERLKKRCMSDGDKSLQKSHETLQSFSRDSQKWH